MMMSLFLGLYFLWGVFWCGEVGSLCEALCWCGGCGMEGGKVCLVRGV
jgi:hypothetical protein